MKLNEAIAQACATMEGFYKPGSVAQRNGNPGNLRSWGSRPIVDGYAAFLKPDETPDPDKGWAALRRQCQLNINRGLTLIEFFSGKPGVYPGYAPKADKNDPRGYAQYVAGRLKIPADVPLDKVAWPV